MRSKINVKTLYWHFTNLVRYDVFNRTLKRLKTIYAKNIIKKYKRIDILIDASVINNKYGVNKIGRNKFHKNKKVTKLSLMTDSYGYPLSILFMKGNRHDNIKFNDHIRDIPRILKKRKIRILADKGYSSSDNYKLLEKNNMEHIIPPRKNMKIYKSYIYLKSDYIKRIKIENIFGILKNYKRISIRYDKLLRNFRGFISLGLLIVVERIMNKNLLLNVLVSKQLKVIKHNNK